MEKGAPAPPGHPLADSDEAWFDKFSQDLYGKLIEATKLSNTLPVEDYGYYATFRPFKSQMQQTGKRLRQLTRNILDYTEGGTSKSSEVLEELTDPEVASNQFMNCISPFVPQLLQEVADSFDIVVDVLDTLIEKVDIYSDEAKGETHKPNIKISQAKLSSSGPSSRGSELYMFHGSNILRPQLKFEDEIDNSNTPWVPRLRSKPNALVPWTPPAPPPATRNDLRQPRETITREMESHLSNLGVRITSQNPPRVQSPGYPHPYEYEINNFLYNEWQMRSEPEIPYRPLEETPCRWVSTREQLVSLVQLLNRQREFAVDLEQHSYRSFQGFCCLMQISTREEDFLIDALELRSHMHLLNEPFTNPKIVKVLHGADSDIPWLQRDFGVYVVNMFDTGQAARVLEFPSFSLAYLLHTFCNITADKKYQLADWRIRPLPDEMIKYAREDTHYLLYIYDRLRNDLVARGNASNNLILAVLNRSKAICLKKYEKELWTETSHLNLYNKHNLFFNAAQMRVFAALYAWRDRVAREEDESTRYVLPNHMLFHISEVMPVDIPALLACCNPVPPLVRQHSADLATIIREARDAPDTPAEPRPSQAAPSATVPKTPVIESPLNASGEPSVFHSSPVLNVDQLFASSGWRPAERPDSVTAVSASVYLSELNRNLQSSRPLASSLWIDSSSSEEEDEDTKETFLTIKSSLESSFPLPKPQSRSASKESSAPAATPVPVPSTPAPAEEKTKSKEKAEKADDEDRIPQSMAEIYQLSNKNRKRNKEKKKLKEDSLQSSMNTSPVYIDDEEGDEKEKRKRHKGGPKDTMEFMREIGWVDSVTDRRPLPHAEPKGRTFTPHDYSATDSAFALPPPSTAPAPSHPPQQEWGGRQGGKSSRHSRQKSGHRSMTFQSSNPSSSRR